MGKNTFTVTLKETGESKSVTINILEPEFIKGWWSYDKEGKNVYVYGKDKISVPLEETMYFHVETKGLAIGQELTLKLYDYDYTFLWDYLDPDDEKFPDEEVQKKAKVKELNGKRVASVELYLDKEWEKLIKDDFDNPVSLDRTIELYWEVIYGWRKKSLPEKKGDYLRVAFSERTLYLKPSLGTGLPEFMNYKGENLLLMELKGKAKGKIIDKLRDKALEKVLKKIGNNRRKIFFVKMNNKNVGKNIKVAGVIRNVGNALNIFDLLKLSTEDLDTSKSMSMPLGVFTPINELAGVITLEQKRDLDNYLEDSLQRDLTYAKSLGLTGVKKFVYTYQDEYGLEAISKETADKLLRNEFKTMDEVVIFNESTGDYDSSIHILFRKEPNKDRNLDEEIIETIIINE